MTERLQVYKCEVCGNIVEVFHKGAGELVCCGVPMKLLGEKTADYKLEKHVPMIEKIDGGFKVTVGSTLHPMEAEHFIEWIEIADEKGNVYRKHLKPGDAPEALFKIDAEKIVAREHCNKHGLWKGE